MLPEIFFTCSIITLLIFLIILFNERFLIGFVIVTLLSFPSDLSPALRTVIHLSDFLAIGYLFIREYGFDFQKYPKVPGLLTIFFIIFYSGMAISVLFSSYMLEGIYLIVQTTVFFLFVYFLYALISTQEHVRIIILSLIVSGIILTGSIIIEFFILGGNLINPIRFRNFGFYSNINTSGLYIIILFPLTLATLYLKQFHKYKTLSIILLTFLSISVILISSRVAFFGVILGTAIVLFFLNKKLFKTFTFIFISLALIHLILNPFGPIIDIALRLEEGLSQHDHFWQLAVNIIKSHPILGIGPGAYSYEEFNYIPVMLSSYSGQVMIYINDVTFGSNNSHNFYLVLISDMGIIGAISSVLLPTIFFKIAYITQHRYKKLNREIYIILISIISVGICIFIRSFGESIGILSYGAISTDLPFWLLFVILISYYKNKINFQGDHSNNYESSFETL